METVTAYGLMGSNAKPVYMAIGDKALCSGMPCSKRELRLTCSAQDKWRTLASAFSKTVYPTRSVVHIRAHCRPCTKLEKSCHS